MNIKNKQITRLKIQQSETQQLKKTHPKSVIFYLRNKTKNVISHVFQLSKDRNCSHRPLY